MKVFVVGGGGREHALCWKINQSDRVDEVFCAPGNAGISRIARTVDIPSTDINELANFAEEKGIDLTVVGPEAPLAAGIVDQFQDRGLPIFGPNQEAARLESSKVFTRKLTKEHGIPSPRFREFERADEAKNYLSSVSYPTVVKADGLAAGKGSIVCETEEEATEAVNRIMLEKDFGDAGNRLVVEEYLEGVEASLLAICQGTNLVILDPSQDHKQIYEGDEGPNTGGMGAYCPTPFVDAEMQEEIVREMFLPTLHAMNKKGVEFKGVLYAGLMLTNAGPKLLEYNVRFGDPEAQPILMRMESDLVPYLEAAVRGNLEELDAVSWLPDHALCVVAASEGYPIDYDTGYRISGLDSVSGEGVEVFHAGTALQDDEVVTDGGRVLGVTARGSDLKKARDRAYEEMEKIHFRGLQYRTDIGHHVFEREDLD